MEKEVGLIGIKGTMSKTLKRAGLVRDFRNPTLLFNLGLEPQGVRESIPPALRDRTLNAVLIMNKFRQNKILAEAGVSVPSTFQEFPRDFEGIVIKKPYHSSRGRGIEIVQGPVQGRHYYQQCVDKRREFRAHVATWFDPPCFSIQEKKPKEQGTNGYIPDAKQRLCWNLENGWWFTRSTEVENHMERCRNTGLFRRIDEIARRALAALRYDYGAVDVIMDKERELYVLEVNTAPGLKDKSVVIYEKVFKVLVEDVKEGTTDAIEGM